MSGARSFPCRSGGLLFAAGSDRENDFPFLYSFLYRRSGKNLIACGRDLPSDRGPEREETALQRHFSREKQPSSGCGRMSRKAAERAVSRKNYCSPKNLSNELWEIFTIFCCKRCPFMIVYIQRDLKLHKTVAKLLGKTP